MVGIGGGGAGTLKDFRFGSSVLIYGHHCLAGTASTCPSDLLISAFRFISSAFIFFMSTLNTEDPGIL